MNQRIRTSATKRPKEGRAATVADAAREARLYNVKLLLHNFRLLQAMATDTVPAEQCSSEALKEIFQRMSSAPDLSLTEYSMQERAEKTAVLVTYLKQVIGKYQHYCEGSNRPEIMRRYEIIYNLYFSDSPVMVPDLVESMALSRSSVYDTIDKAVMDLAVLLFGIDGITLFS